MVNHTKNAVNESCSTSSWEIWCTIRRNTLQKGINIILYGLVAVNWKMVRLGILLLHVCMSGSSNLNSFRDRRCRDELISDVLLWTPTHGRAKAGRPARTYIQQLCEDTGCCPEDLPRAMNDRDEWRVRVRDIRATSATWWWWWWLTNGFR